MGLELILFWWLSFIQTWIDYFWSDSVSIFAYAFSRFRNSLSLFHTKNILPREISTINHPGMINTVNKSVVIAKKITNHAAATVIKSIAMKNLKISHSKIYGAFIMMLARLERWPTQAFPILSIPSILFMHFIPEKHIVTVMPQTRMQIKRKSIGNITTEHMTKNTFVQYFWSEKEMKPINSQNNPPP